MKDILPPPQTRGDRVPPSLMRSGHMEQAKRFFPRYLRVCGDVDIAVKRIGRSMATVQHWRKRDPEFAAAWDDAQQFHDDLLAGRLKGQTTYAVDVVIDALEQTKDLRLAVAVAEKRIAKSGIEGSPEAEAPNRSGPAISVIIIREQPKAEPEPDAIPVDSVVVEP